MEKDRYSETHVAICVHLSPALYKEVKDFTISHNLKLKEIVADSLRAYLAKHSEGKTQALFPTTI